MSRQFFTHTRFSPLLPSLPSLLPLLPLLLCVAGGCTRTIYLPSETRHAVSVDTLFRTVTRADSVILRDSVFVFQKGDTIARTVIRERTRIRNLTDTLYRTRVDTLRIKETVAVPAPQAASFTTRLKTTATGILLGAGSLLILILLRRLTRRSGS